MTDELMHYGILGMRWGVRRYQNKDGSLTPAGKKHYQKEKSDKTDWKDKESFPKKEIHKNGEPYTKEELMSFKSASQVWAHRNEYTDNELRQVMNRIQSEQLLAQMASKENEKKVSKGKKFIQDTLASAVQETAKSAITGVVKYEAKKLVSSQNPELAAAMFGGSPKKKEEK